MSAEDEARQRRAAEIEFVHSAYTEDEAWVDVTASRCYRRLSVPDQSGITVILSLTMPDGYPVDEEAALIVDARISDDTVRSASSSLRKIVIDALPSLTEACRLSAVECAGSESIFAVLCRADEWVSTDFMSIMESSSGSDGNTNYEIETEARSEVDEVVLGRRLIHSHHIIAQSKRKAIVELADQYNIGGYFKIGWPGIIVIEGEECDCTAYIDEIRSMRWQHLVVRGEEHVTVKGQEELKQARVLPHKMHGLGDDMSCIAERCKLVGLEELFLTSMKIYSRKESATSDSSKVTESNDAPYGVLCHVDHMRDGKGYRKWLRKASAAAECNLMVKACDSNSKRQLIIVSIMGEESDVKRVLKRWRTSRVDVDSNGKPCLERMMTVLTEGSLLRETNENKTHGLDKEDQLIVSYQNLCNIIQHIGGLNWLKEFESLVHRK